MHEMRHEILHWSYRQLSEAARVSVPQLCEYEKGVGRLREDQQRKCKAILLRGVRAHGRPNRVKPGRLLLTRRSPLEENAGHFRRDLMELLEMPL
jgi:hypothetical protein